MYWPVFSDVGHISKCVLFIKLNMNQWQPWKEVKCLCHLAFLLKAALIEMFWVSICTNLSTYIVPPDISRIYFLSQVPKHLTNTVFIYLRSFLHVYSKHCKGNGSSAGYGWLKPYLILFNRTLLDVIQRKLPKCSEGFK